MLRPVTSLRQQEGEGAVAVEHRIGFLPSFATVTSKKYVNSASAAADFLIFGIRHSCQYVQDQRETVRAS